MNINAKPTTREVGEYDYAVMVISRYTLFWIEKFHKAHPNLTHLDYDRLIELLEMCDFNEKAINEWEGLRDAIAGEFNGQDDLEKALQELQEREVGLETKKVELMQAGMHPLDAYLACCLPGDVNELLRYVSLRDGFKGVNLADEFLEVVESIT